MKKVLEDKKKNLVYFMHACSVASVVSDSVTPWTVACQVPLTMGVSGQEY